MKKKEWLKSLDGVDEKFVPQAAPTGAHRKARSGKTVRMLSILAACMCFVLLAGTFALFIPYKTTPPSVAKYADSEYYSIIEKLNEYNYDPPAYKNTFELLLDLPSNLFAKAEDWAPGATNEAENMTGTGNYQEVTDNQVSGVIEADLIKRSDTHIYYLSSGTLRIFSIEGEDSKGVIFDGFPRTTAQAEAFDEILAKHGQKVSVMINMEVPEEELVKRILLRGKDSGRADDQSEEIIRNRIDVYNAQTAVVANFYQAQGKFESVPSLGTIEEVADRIAKVVEKYL